MLSTMVAAENPQGEPRKSNLENLENRLYSRTPPPLRHAEEFGREERHIRIAPGWTEEAERKDSGFYRLIASIMPWLKRIFIASVIFALFAGSIALYGFWRGANTVSSQNISLEVAGPVAAPAGEELVMEVNIGNYNQLLVESVNLLVEYPEGTRKPQDVSEPLLRYREELGKLEPGATLSRRLSAVPFAEEGEKQTVHVTVEYRSKDSNAIFSKKSVYEFVINAAPVTVTVVSPKEVNSGQVFELVLELTSNASAGLKNLIVKAEYPAGFQFVESNPAATFSKDTWYFGDLKAGGKRTLRVKGRIDAVEEEERTFRFSVGTQSPKDEKQLGTVFLSETPSVVVKRPFVGLDLVLNGEKGKTFIAKGAGPLRADIIWGNNLSSKIADLEITAKLEGSIYSKNSVESNGFYDSNTATITWDKRNTAGFSAVEPGADGTVTFSFNLLPTSDAALYKNPSMQLHVFARGKRLDEQGAFQEVVSSFTKDVRVASTLSLSTRLLYNGGAFTNRGPLPPKAEQETTYTVIWSLSNSSNGVSDAEVKAILPTYVKWLGQVSPVLESVEYNPLGGEVVWSAGNLAAGVGLGSSPREVAFQISFLPSVSQSGTMPALIGEAAATAEDRFTGVDVKSNVRPPLSTGSLPDGAAKGVVQN